VPGLPAQPSLKQLRHQAARPGLAGTVRAARPALIVWAAAQGRPGSVELPACPPNPASSSSATRPETSSARYARATRTRSPK
jgi:hypothetical protein